MGSVQKVSDHTPPTRARTQTGTYARILSDFAKYHTSPLNIFLHLFTTPLCLLAVCTLLFQYTPFFCVCVGLGVYTISLLFFLPIYLSAVCTVAVCGIGIGGYYMAQTLSPLVLLVGFTVSYFTQDLAHIITQEPTFQSTYIYQNPLLLLEHTYFLLPLVIDVSVKNRLWDQVLDYYVLRSHVFYTKCQTETNTQDMGTIRAWLDEEQLPRDVTSHWWFSTLPGAIHTAFDRIVNSREVLGIFFQRYSEQMYTVEPVPEMNEVYVSTTANNKINSDLVFYSNHVDGPFMFMPFVAIYRGVLVLTDNKLIRTVFPEVPTAYVLSEGDACFFDFNREIHRIEQVQGVEQEKLRYSLKIHYAVYPKCLKPYGRLVAWLTAKYDLLARYLFLQTLRPATLFQHWLSRFILFCTHVTFGVVQYGGGANVLNYVMFVGLMSYFTPVDFPLFLYLTSFVHYFIYIATYYHRGTDVAFEKFKHVVMAYKALAVAHLGICYILHFEYHLLSLTLIAVGVTLSTTAGLALGMDKTYFGYELGRVKDDGTFKVTCFPYNLGIPHPMIVGNLIWLAGFELLPGIRKNCPHVTYIHGLLYLIHMLQEHFDIHRARFEKHTATHTHTHTHTTLTEKSKAM